jgi:hypothetical protein
MRWSSTDILAFLWFLALLGLIAWVIYLRHKKAVLRHQERMSALEKGLTLPDLEDRDGAWTPRVYLLRGLLWLSAGTAVTVMLATVTFTSRRQMGMRSRLEYSKELRAMGATEEQVRQGLAVAETRHDGPPGGLYTIGLVPMAVGVAYLIFYKREQAAEGENSRNRVVE